MKKLLFLGAFITSQAFGALETITTYRDKELTKPGLSFKDGATVYVAATVPGMRGTLLFGAVTSLFPHLLPWPPTPESRPNTLPLVFEDISDNDGIYTAEFTISSTQAQDKLLVKKIGAIISVDIDNDGNIGNQMIIADYDPPVISIGISDYRFSPYTSGGYEDFTIISLTSKETGTYKITMEGKELYKGDISANIPSDFFWDGYYWDKQRGTWQKFTEGSHTIEVSIFDLAGNESKGSDTITIDSTYPVISASADPVFFSPGTSTDSKDYCYVSFSSNEPGRYEVLINGRVPTGTYFGNFSNKGIYTWDGSYITGPADEGPHTIRVKIWDNAGNWKEKKITVFIDRQWPEILSFTENTGADTFYRNEIIQFTLKARDFRGDIGTTPCDYGNGSVTFNGEIVPLFYCREGYKDEGSIYQGYYEVKDGDYGTFTPLGFLFDKAGNPALNTGTSSSKIKIDGTRVRPTEESRIIRLGMIPEKEKRPSLSPPIILGSSSDSITLKFEGEYNKLKPSQKVRVVDRERKHIWVGSVTDNTVILNNGLLYYGEPVSDYRGVNIGACFGLKKCVKKDDNIIFSLTAVAYKKKFILSPPFPSGTASLTIYNNNITKNSLILVSDNIRAWLGTATDNGSFTISNKNLYSGPIPSDYNRINTQALVAGEVYFAKGGDAKLDIGAVRKNIPLSDDGVDGIGILDGDIRGGDGIYSSVYRVKNEDETSDTLIIGNFIYNRKKAENAPYSDNRIKITIDSTLPEIKNTMVSPVPFNPYKSNLSIDYFLSEKSYVTIKIIDKSGNIIRILNSFDAQFGENVWMFWDGKNSGGGIVPDGRYDYTIEAEDEAGNKAVAKGGEIILTLLEIRIKTIDVNPNPFRPRPNLEETADVVIDFKMELISSDGNPVKDSQLKNLGFYFDKGYYMIDCTNGEAWASFPHGLLDFKIFDKNGRDVGFGMSFPDLNKGEEDPWPGGILYYNDVDPYWFYPSPYLANESCKDMPDGNAGNDYSILRGFNRINGKYTARFGLWLYDWDIEEGKYILQATTRLVGIWWTFILDKTKCEEKFHALPDYTLGYGLKSDYFEVAIEVLKPEKPELPDSLPPEVIASHPANGEEFRQGTISEVWVRLKDKPDSGAVGIDLGRSEIFLLDSKGNKIGGKIEKDGIDKLSWKLNSPLGMGDPGLYIISIETFDKNNNFASYSITFRIIDITPPDVSNPNPEAIVITPFEDDIYCFVSDVGRGNSGIDWEKTTISLKRDNISIPVDKLYFKDSGKLVARGSLTSDGTYTVFVKAYDGVGNLKTFTWSFYLKTIVPKLYNPHPFSGVLSPYTGTISIEISELEEGASGINWQRSNITLKDPDNNIIGLIVTHKLGTSNNIGILIGSPTISLTKNGVWTFIVEAYDFAEHTTIGIYTFQLRDVLTARIKLLKTSDYRFSPGTSTGIKDTITITYAITDEDGTGTLLIGNETLFTGFLEKDKIYPYLLGSPTISEEGSHTISLVVIDKTGSISTGSISVYVDNTYPKVLNITNNTGGRTFFRDEIIFFILTATDTDIHQAKCILDSIPIKLIKIGDTLYQGYYQVKEQDKGVWSVKGFLMDEAGNGATSTVFGTITVDGGRLNLASPRIIRFSMMAQENRALEAPAIIGSTTDTLSLKWKEQESLKDNDRIKVISGSNIWITTIKNNQAEISNEKLYSGFPVPDYKNIAIGSSYLLKSLLKKDDRIIVSLEAIRIEEGLSFQNTTKTQGSLTITSNMISKGMLILVYGGACTWLSLADKDGSFTISNANLYSGTLVSDYNLISTITINRVNNAAGGDASFDIGSLRRNIPLRDDGIFCDKTAGDGVYSGDYVVAGDDVGENIPIIGYFYTSGIKALNSPYYNGKISMDGVKPIIRNSSALPSPFNPYNKTKLNIRYNLPEPCSVVINIKDKALNVIMTIKDQQAKNGDNIETFWDGRDMFGHIVSDGRYYYTIDAWDIAKNQGDTVQGEIRVTSLEMKPTELVISPNPFWPDETIEGSIDTLVKFKVVLKSSKGGPVTDSQLNNLGFDLKQGYNDLNVPYGLLHFDIYDVKNNTWIKHEGYPDMTGGTDIDPWLAGYYPVGNLYKWSRAYPSKLNYGNYVDSLGDPKKPDKGDGDAENDFGCLVPLLRDNVGNYYCYYEYGERDWKSPPGTYILRVWAELVSIAWERKSADDAAEETWHAKPRYHGHYGFQSDFLYGEMKVMEKETPVSPDKEPPIVETTSPYQGEVKEPYSVSSISVKLNDKAPGVSLKDSKIELKDSAGNPIPGTLTNNGIDTLYLYLEPLVTPGIYTIKIKAVDKNGNIGNYSITFSIRDGLAPMISILSPADKSTVQSPFTGPIRVNISEIGRGLSDIDWQNTKLVLKKDGAEIPLTSTYTVTGSWTGVLIGTPISPLTLSGTYTISVFAYDTQGNPANLTFSFSIPTEIQVIYNGDIYLDIPYGTEIIPPNKNINIGTNTIFVVKLPSTKDHKEYKLIGSITKFYYGTNTPLYKHKFTKDVTLTLSYEKKPSPEIEGKLSIFGTGSGWTRLGGTIDTNTNKISLTIKANTEIKDMYAIMYDEDDPPKIEHTPPPAQLTNETIKISATVIDEGVGIASITLCYEGSTQGSIIMTQEGTSTFKASIPPQGKGLLKYSLVAIDKNLNIGSSSYSINVITKDEANIDKAVYTLPNPAKGYCNFRLYLLESASVKIEVYTLSGERVWDYEGNHPAGECKIPYDCKNEDGAKLGTGLYIYKVTIKYPTRKESIIKKMVIIKQ